MIELGYFLMLGDIVLKPNRQIIKVTYNDKDPLEEVTVEQILGENTVTGRLIAARENYITLDTSTQYHKSTVDIMAEDVEFISIEVIEEVPF